MDYKAPKLKLKKRKMDYGMTGKSSEDAMIEEGKGKPKRTPLKLKKKKEGKILYRKGGKSKATIMDERKSTEYMMKDMMEKERMKGEEKLKLKLKRMK